MNDHLRAALNSVDLAACALQAIAAGYGRVSRCPAVQARSAEQTLQALRSARRWLMCAITESHAFESEITDTEITDE